MAQDSYPAVLFKTITELNDTKLEDGVQMLYDRASADPFDAQALDRLLAILGAAQKYASWKQDGISASFEAQGPGVLFSASVRNGSSETPFGENVWIAYPLDTIVERVHNIFPADKDTSPFHPSIRLDEPGTIMRLLLTPAVAAQSIPPGAPVSLPRPSPVPLSGNPEDNGRPVRSSRIIPIGERTGTQSTGTTPALPRPPDMTQSSGSSPYAHAQTVRPLESGESQVHMKVTDPKQQVG